MVSTKVYLIFLLGLFFQQTAILTLTFVTCKLVVVCYRRVSFDRRVFFISVVSEGQFLSITQTLPQKDSFQWLRIHYRYNISHFWSFNYLKLKLEFHLKSFLTTATQKPAPTTLNPHPRHTIHVKLFIKDAKNHRNRLIHFCRRKRFQNITNTRYKYKQVRATLKVTVMNYLYIF